MMEFASVLIQNLSHILPYICCKEAHVLFLFVESPCLHIWPRSMVIIATLQYWAECVNCSIDYSLKTNVHSVVRPLCL